jgi:hypothetical protein
MSEIASKQEQGGSTSQASVQDLAGLADQALVTGDYNSCVALVGDIYDLLDRQTRSPLNGEQPQ